MGFQVRSAIPVRPGFLRLFSAKQTCFAATCVQKRHPSLNPRRQCPAPSTPEQSRTHDGVERMQSLRLSDLFAPQVRLQPPKMLNSCLHSIVEHSFGASLFIDLHAQHLEPIDTFESGPTRNRTVSFAELISEAFQARISESESQLSEGGDDFSDPLIASSSLVTKRNVVGPHQHRMLVAISFRSSMFSSDTPSSCFPPPFLKRFR